MYENLSAAKPVRPIFEPEHAEQIRTKSSKNQVDIKFSFFSHIDRVNVIEAEALTCLHRILYSSNLVPTWTGLPEWNGKKRVLLNITHWVLGIHQ